MDINSNMGRDHFFFFPLGAIAWILFTQNHERTYTQTPTPDLLVSSGGTQVQTFEKVSRVTDFSYFPLWKTSIKPVICISS